MSSLERAVLLLAAVSLTTASAAGAQAGIGARASTLGVGAELSYRVNRTIGVRGGFNWLEFTRDATLEGVPYDLTPRFESGTLLLDLYPMGGSLHLTGGLLINGNEGRMSARLDGPVTINGQTYDPSEINSITGRVSFRRTAPYVGLGIAGSGRIGILFDLGVAISGHPRVAFASDHNLTGPEQTAFEANLQAEQDEVQADLDSRDYLRFHPVLSLGIRFRL